MKLGLVFLTLFFSGSYYSQKNLCEKKIDKAALVSKGNVGKMVYYEIESCRFFMPDTLDKSYGSLFTEVKLKGDCFLESKFLAKNCYEDGYYHSSQFDSVSLSPAYLQNYKGKYVIFFGIKKIKKNTYLIYPETCFLSKGSITYKLVVRRKHYKLTFIESEI